MIDKIRLKYLEIHHFSLHFGQIYKRIYTFSGIIFVVRPVKITQWIWWLYIAIRHDFKRLKLLIQKPYPTRIGHIHRTVAVSSSTLIASILLNLLLDLFFLRMILWLLVAHVFWIDQRGAQYLRIIELLQILY